MKLLFFASWMLLSTLCSAQNDLSQNRMRLRFVGFELGSNFYRGSAHNLSLVEHQDLMMNNGISNNDIFGFTNAQSQHALSNNIIHLAMSFNCYKTAGDYFVGYPQIRIGMSVNNLKFNDDFFVKNDRRTIDTVFVNGIQHNVDSTAEVSVSATNITNRIRLSFQVLWQTNPKYRFYVYGGMGFSLGFSAYSYMNYNYNIRGRKELINENGSLENVFDDYEFFEAKQIKALPWLDYALHIPLGIDFRLGNANKSRPWRFLHIFFEVTPTYWVSSARGIRPLGSSGLLFSGGYRFRLLDWR